MKKEAGWLLAILLLIASIPSDLNPLFVWMFNRIDDWFGLAVSSKLLFAYLFTWIIIVALFAGIMGQKRDASTNE